MSNRPLPPPVAEPAAAARSKVPVIVAAVVGFALVAAIGSVLAARGSSKATTATTAGAAVAAAGGAVAPAETQAVQVSGTALAALPKSGTDPALGQRGPTLSGSTFSGAPVTITPGTKPTLIVFVTHWCPHCQREVPLLAAWLASADRPSGVDVAFVSTSVTSSRSNYPPSAWLSKAPSDLVSLGVPLLADDADSAAAQAYGLTSFPYFVMLKGDGTVAKRGVGELALADLTQLLAAAAG